MGTTRRFKNADYEATLNKQIRLGDALPANHLARFIVEIIGQLDMSRFYKQYSERGGEAYAPEVLLGLLLYSYATGMFSSREIEKATVESIPHHYIAGGMRPDHDTISHFRQRFLNELKAVFVELLLIGQAMGHLQMGNISLDGSKIHADASKHSAVSYARLQELMCLYEQEIAEILALAAQADSQPWPADFCPTQEIALREARLSRLAEAKAVLESRATVRYNGEVAAYEEKLAERAEYTQRTGKKLGGRTPQAPTSGAHDKDQYNFTDPESRIMKQGNSDGFEQAYNAQIAVDHESRLIVANTLSNHPTDAHEAIPTLQAIPQALGKPTAAALDAGFFSTETVKRLAQMGIDPYIATGRLPHHRHWRTWFEQTQPSPPADASLRLLMAYKLQTKVGQAIYRLRKSTVEPVFGIIKETLGFRQFSLRRLVNAAGEWNLVCLAYNLKRLYILETA